MKQTFVFGCFAIIAAVFITRWTAEQPGYTDAYYYFNAAQRLVNGDGLTDAYLWTYTASPESLPAPSHLYWMPLTSLASAFGMWITNSPGDYTAAQFPLALLYAAAAMTAYWLGLKLGRTRRHAWVAGMIMLFSGFYTRVWGMTDAFAPYAAVGSLALVFSGLALQSLNIQGKRFLALAFIAGIFAGLGHLTRADGMLLSIVGIVVFFLQGLVIQRNRLRQCAAAVALLIAGYLVVMLPWFVRNLDVIGTPLPVGGAQAIWYSQYDDLFNYPPGVTASDLFADGPGTFIDSRWTAITNALGTFVAVEGLIIMAPLMLIGLWNRRKNLLLQPFWLYALGLHLAMTLVFPFPGYRGGLFHSAAALMPFWAGLGVVGLDDTVDWIAKRRRNWNAPNAKRVFSIGLVALAVLLSWSLISNNRVGESMPRLFTQLAEALPEESRIMINDPAQLYYFTGYGGVVIPNAAVHVIPEIAQKYDIDYLLIETSGGIPAVPGKFDFDLNDPPEFLEPVSFDVPGTRLYAINPS